MLQILLLLNSNTLRAIPKTEVCLQRINQNFSSYHLDSCLYYSYLLSHCYRIKADSTNLAKTWYNIAFVNLMQDQFTQAQAARQIAEIYLKGNFLVPPQHIYLGLYYYKTNAYKNAHKFLTEALKNNTLPHQLKYILRIYLADTQHNLYPKKNESISIEKIIKELNSQNGTASYAYGLSYFMLGKFAYDNGEYDRCISYFEKSLYCFEHNHIPNQYWLYCYRFITVSLWNIGRTDTGNLYFQRLSDILEKNSLLKAYLPYYYLVKGEISSNQLENQEALNSYLKAYNACRSGLGNKVEIVGNMIECYYYLKQYDQVVNWTDSCEKKFLNDYQKILTAHSFLKTGRKTKAYEICNQVLLNYNYNNSFYSLLNFSKFYADAGDYDKTEYFNKILLKYALKYFKRVNYNTNIAYSEIAFFYWYAKSDFSKSLYYYHCNVYSLIDSKYCDNYYALPDISKSIDDKALATALNNKAEALYEVSKLRKTQAEKLRDLQGCLANWELSFTVSHRYKMSLPRDDQRYAYADLIKHRFNYIIKTCYNLYQITSQQKYCKKAFEYAEKSKASMLLSTVRGINAYKMNFLPGSLKKEEDMLWTKSELLSKTLAAEYNSRKPDLERIDKTLNTLYGFKMRQDSLIRIFKLNFPTYYNAHYNDEVIGADSLQRLLQPNEAMLQYSLSADKLVIFLLTRNNFKIFTDSLDNKFFTDVETYRKKLSGFSYNDLMDTAVRSYANLANRLYNRLVKPAESLIRGKKLIIIPDDVLTQVPFESLVTTPILSTSQASLRGLSYLVRLHAVDYGYSGTLFAMHNQTSVYHKARLLGIAPSYKKLNLKELNAHDSASIRRDSSELLPIPGTIDEVKDIYRIFGGKMLLRGQATEKQFIEIANNYDILHLATHGVINNEYPLFSKLIFKPSPDSINDGLLNTYEIYNMQISAPLVVLSACNSGYGKLHKGEGIISLARGFFTAGAKSIIMTLWSIGDKTSSKLMHQFYTNLAAHQNIGNAMQNAKIEYLEQTDEMKAHPYFWAGYIVLGNSNAIFEPDPAKNYFHFWWVFALVLAGSGLIAGRKKVKALIANIRL
jgi:CHAT domain-containing protein